MAFRHGVYKSEVPTSLVSPVQTDSGLPVALFAMSPCVLINVLDPSTHKETVAPADFTITNGEANLGQDVILASGLTFEAGTTYTAGVDYSLGYDDAGNAILSIIKGGRLANASKIKTGFTRLKPSMITANDIIGGVDASTGDYTGLELINSVFPLTGTRIFA